MKTTDHERHIKECLEKRRVQPRANLWEDLERELDKKEKRRHTKKIYRWVGMVAILIGLFWGGSLLGPTPQHRISKVSKKAGTVDSTFDYQKPEGVQERSKGIQFSVLPPDHEKEGSQRHEDLEEQATIVATSPSRQPGKKGSSSSPKLNREATQTDESLREVENLSSSEERTIQEEDSMLYTTIADRDETEILLREALYREFLVDMKKEGDSVRILARGEQLLKEINLDLEKEEDRAFRDKIWRAIQKGWDKARSAVAVNPRTP